MYDTAEPGRDQFGLPLLDLAALPDPPALLLLPLLLLPLLRLPLLHDGGEYDE